VDLQIFWNEKTGFIYKTGHNPLTVAVVMKTIAYSLLMEGIL